MIASSGAPLLAPGAQRAIVDELLPLATLLTPNLPEAEALTGLRIGSERAMDLACEALLARGAQAVLLKGGHLRGRRVVDVLRTHSTRIAIANVRLAREGHGTGCTLASAIAAQLALGVPLEAAVRDAVAYVHGALARGSRPGRGRVHVLEHFWRLLTRSSRRRRVTHR
jgi:hydroxymethylpyrimidine/phosphomethylpyrimidine kinase